MDQDSLKYLYEELIISLITMSLPAEKQKEIIGYGCVGDEILEDFDSFYTMQRLVYVNNEVFNKGQLELLDNFNKFLDKLSGQSEEFYWNIQELKSNPLWEELRREAKEVLSNVFGKQFSIEIHRAYKQADGMTIEHTKRKLIEKND